VLRQIGEDLLVGVPGFDALAHQPAQICGERRVRIVD
jgi:hypothetical protein